MNTCKGAMDDLDFLSDFRLILLLDNADPLFKSRIAQHSELHHLSVGDFYRTVCIPMFQNVKGGGASCEQGNQLSHGYLKLNKHVIMNDGHQNPMGLKVIANLLFRISHRDKTGQAFLLQEVTYHHLMSVEGANHRPNLIVLLHFLPFPQQDKGPTRSNLTF